MKAKRVVFMILVLVLLVGMISVEASPLSPTAASQAWKVQLFKGGEDGVKNLSTAFVGEFQTPMLSYSKVGLHHIYEAHAATSAVTGNCGFNNTWYCSQWNDTDLVPGTVSQMATEQLIDSHLIKWAYSTGSKIRGATIELMDDMSFLTESWQDLIQLSKFGGTLVGTPSLQSWGGHYRMATTIRSGGDFPTYKLVYMYYVGGSSNTSCIDGGSAYQCDVIEEAYLYDSMGAPSLQLAPDGSVGIAYYKYGGGVQDGLKYAYPHTDSLFDPSNCGPGVPKTWRCISIFEGTETGTLGNVVNFAFGQTSSDRGIVFTYDDILIENTLYNAKYVGSGGNCGKDGTILNPDVYKWRCSDIVGVPLAPYYSIAIDPQGYSVIAYNGALGEFSPINLYIAYPKARVGIAEPGWIEQEIDGTTHWEVATGAQAALSINSTGLGFISYLQEEDYELPDLKITWQPYAIYFPFTKR